MTPASRRAAAVRAALALVAAASTLLARAPSPAAGGRDPSAGAQAPATPEPFDAQTRARILQHSPLPELPPDPTNAHADDPRAAHLGRFLFFDERLSSNGALACASCHVPAQGFADGRSLSRGLADGTRNTASLWNAAWQRWYFWDGRSDSLWAQALKPLEHASELGSNRMRIVHALAGDPELARAYRAVFGPLPDVSDARRFPPDARPIAAAPEHPHARAWSAMSAADRDAVDRAFANVGKALAAYERGIVSRDAPFDRFVAALRADDEAAQSAYPADARRGLALFVGKAGCRTCHSGPAFSDNEFHNIGVPTLDRAPPRDTGRHGGLDELALDPFNAAGAFSDDPAGERARELGLLERTNESWGQFKTPTLRNVARSAPYMHQGQFATLHEVLEYYSTLAGAIPAGHHGERVLAPLELSGREIDDLLAFLASLTDESALARVAEPPPSPVPRDERGR